MNAKNTTPRFPLTTNDSHYAKAEAPVVGEGVCSLCGQPIRANAHGVLRHVSEIKAAK